MSIKTREVGTAALVGVVVDGVVAGLLSTSDLSFVYAILIGAFVGGIGAGYILHGGVREAAIAGALSGVLGAPFLLGVSDMLTIFGLISVPPSTPRPSLADLQAAVALIVAMNVVVSTIGSTLIGAVRRPYKVLATPLPPSGVAPGQVRYCVQCGAQLLSGAVVCPHCNARQPQ
jgi:hypothetical protein